MSIEYDEYINEHVGAVRKGWQWMEENLLPRLEDWIETNYKADEFDIFDVRELVANHDRSKIEPDEYYFYDDYFYLRKDNRSSEVMDNFHRAFLMHMHRNPHHWQYWVMSSDNKGEPSRCIEMPLPYIFEMICDWWSFSWRAGDLTTIFKWWDDHKDYIQLHKKSRRTVEKILEEMKKILVTEKDEPQPNDRDPLPPDGVKEIATEIQHVPEETADNHISHYGILGMKWGVRRFQNEDGTRTALGKAKERAHTVFISGSSKTQSEDSEYYRKELPRPIISEINKHMQAGDKIIVGDAPGIDRQVQDYLHESGYNNVEIYGPGKKVRYSANEEWKTNPIDAPEYKEGSKEWLAKKDIAMTEAADEGLAIILDKGAKATRKNAERLLEANKNVKLFEINGKGAEHDNWVDADPKEYLELLALEYGEKIVHSDDEEDNPKKFGVPEIKKYPMPDADHVRSAIRFFNYIDPKYEKELAEAILDRAKEYGVNLDEMNIGDENRFKNYISDKDDHLEHHGIKGQKWGVRRFQNEDGTRTDRGKEREYYRRRVVRELKNIDDVNRIVSTLSEVEQKELGVSSGDDKWIPDEKRIDQASNIAKTFLEYDGDIPISMLEIWDIGDGRADIALATDPKYRGTGATSRNIQKAISWFNGPENTRFNELQWNNLKENAKSGQIADHYGFGDYIDDDKWEYRRIFKENGQVAIHSGIKGMHWGIKNGPPYPIKDGEHSKEEQRELGLKNFAKAKVANLESWGKDEDHNVLYIAGYSGSGKSTTALALAGPDDTVIHLDAYTELDDDGGYSKLRNKAFTDYLDKNVDKWETVYMSNKEGDNGYPVRHSPEYWKKVDEFDKAIQGYAKEQYKNGHNVIVEGVQIADGWLAPLKDYKDRPVVILQNGPIKSLKRAFERDDRGGLIEGLGGLKSAKEYATWYYNMSKNLGTLAEMSDAKRNEVKK